MVPIESQEDVDEIVNATLTAIAQNATSTPTPEPPPTEVPPTATEVPPTATPEPTATPTLNIPEDDPASYLGEPDGEDDFESQGNWTLFDSQCFKSEITGGQYVMTAKGLPNVACWEVSWPLIDNFYLETLVNMPETCQPDDRFSVLFRAPDNNRGYLYRLSCDGEFSLTKWDGGETTVLVTDTPDDAILVGPGEQNRLGLGVYGSTYYLYANGVYLGQASDGSYLEPGKIGYFVRAASEQPFTVAYDYLRLWNLNDAYYPPGSTPPPDVTPIPPPESDVPTVTTITYVNVRSGPGTNYPIYFVAPPGASAEAVGISEDGGWYVINIPSYGTAWISAEYVVAQNTENLPVYTAPPVPPTVTPDPPSPEAAVGITTETMNVRSGPGSEYPTYGKISRDVVVGVVGQSQDGIWYAIALPLEVSPDGYGWVKAEYVLLSDPNANIPVLQPGDVPPSVPPQPPAEGVVTGTTTEVISVKTGPDSSFPSYGKVPQDTTFEVLGVSQDGGWYAVALPTDVAAPGYGWVNANYVVISNPSGIELPVINP
jgi:uncharacterized protein YraI